MFIYIIHGQNKYQAEKTLSPCYLTIKHIEMVIDFKGVCEKILLILFHPVLREIKKQYWYLWIIFDDIFYLFTGPEKWPELFPMASGHRQSPVNISRESTTRGRSFKSPLTWRYVPENTKSLINPGYCWRVDVNGEGSSLSGGPLSTDVFQLEQFHCHVSKNRRT